MVWLLWGVAKLCCPAKVNWAETWTHIRLLRSGRWRLELEIAHILLAGHPWLRLLCKDIIVCNFTVLLTLVEPRWGSPSHPEAQWRSIKRHMSQCAVSSHIFVFILDLIVFWVAPLIRFICCDWRLHVLVGVSFWVLLYPSTAVHWQSQSQVFSGSPTQLQRIRRPWVLFLGLVNIGEFTTLAIYILIQVAQIRIQRRLTWLNDLGLLFLDWMLIHGTGHFANILTMRALTVVNMSIEITILHWRHRSNRLLTPRKDKLLPKLFV